MRLQIKQTDTPSGYLVALCDEDGAPLPGQLSLSIDSRPGEPVKATVVFAVGEDVVLVAGEQRAMAA